MNRKWLFDSELSLDHSVNINDHWVWVFTTTSLIDASRNMARYYSLSIQQTLFGGTAVVRTWGRIGKAGREMTELFGTERDAISRFLELARHKRKRNYTPARNCGNTG
jgi:predicted DNA-binding WGR domain protein